MPTPSRSRRKSPQRQRSKSTRKAPAARRPRRRAAHAQSAEVPVTISPALRRKFEKLGLRWQIILPKLQAARRKRSAPRK